MKRSFFFILLFCFFSFSIIAESAQERLDQADLLLKEGKEGEAVEIYSSLLSHVGFQRKNEYGKALYRVALLEPMAPVAISLLEKYLPAVENKEYRFDCFFLLALHFDLLGETLSALENYQKAIALYEESPFEAQKMLYWKARFFSAVLLADLGESEEANTSASALIEGCEDSSLVIQATLLESRLLIERQEILQGIEKTVSLLEKKYETYPLLFHHWVASLIQKYPNQTLHLKKSYNELQTQGGKIPLIESVPTLSMALSELKESLLIPLEEKMQNFTTNEEYLLSEKVEKKVEKEQKEEAPVKLSQNESRENIPEKKNSHGKIYWIQVASFKDKENALYYAKELKKKNFSYKITLVNGVGYRVYVIPDENEEINMLLLKLKDAGFEGLLVEK